MPSPDLKMNLTILIHKARSSQLGIPLMYCYSILANGQDIGNGSCFETAHKAVRRARKRIAFYKERSPNLLNP